MKVKKYVVDTMPEALQKIRSELGADAVIVNTREVRVGGFLGLFGKRMVEVVAATDTNPASPPPRTGPARISSGPQRRPEGAVPISPFPPAAAPSAASSRIAAPEAPPELRAGASESAAAAPAASAAPVPPPAPVPPEVRAPAEPGLRAPAEQTPRVPAETGLRAESGARAPNEPEGRARVATSGRDEALLQEMKQMKEMMQRLAAAQAKGADSPPLHPDVFEKIRSRLIDQDVRSDIAGELIDGAAAEFAGRDLEGVRAEEAHAAVKKLVLRRLSKKRVEPIREGAHLVHFVGPTGVGKTTTIAKLAAEQTLKFRRKVGLITSDTYRIAAIEQLRTYASILNIPLEVVFSAPDLRKALEKMQLCEMILMDTAGRNYRNEMAVSELHSLIRSETESDTFLVLSLSMKYSDMKAVTENFHRFGVGKVLFTKADETSTFGSILNLLSDYDLSLSYITNGQNVPDDIQIADPERIAADIVGEPDDE